MIPGYDPLVTSVREGGPQKSLCVEVVILRLWDPSNLEACESPYQLKSNLRLVLCDDGQ